MIYRTSEVRSKIQIEKAKNVLSGTKNRKRCSHIVCFELFRCTVYAMSMLYIQAVKSHITGSAITFKGYFGLNNCYYWLF